MYISEDRLEVVVLTRCFTPFEALQRTDIMEEKSSFYMVASLVKVKANVFKSGINVKVE